MCTDHGHRTLHLTGETGHDYRTLRLRPSGVLGHRQRLLTCWGRLHATDEIRISLVHLLVHASWLDQVEIYFSIVQRKVIKAQDFDDLDILEDRLLAFQDRYNAAAIPFTWRFGRTALHALLDRVDQHEKIAI